MAQHNTSDHHMLGLVAVLVIGTVGNMVLAGNTINVQAKTNKAVYFD